MNPIEARDATVAAFSRVESRQTTIYSPRTDVLEFDDRMEIKLDVPGVAADAIDVKFEENTLLIRAIREENASGGYLHREFGDAQFRRAFTLPKGLDPTCIEASLRNGILTLSLPKAEEMKPRQIKVSGR
ncbi:MAG: Hsp20/alpha crystallin family protein [Planctomycetes bacterium]|nr:Hsp20/alpha crystallin family protein [Planctomycetota bacterium]